MFCSVPTQIFKKALIMSEMAEEMELTLKSRQMVSIFSIHFS